MATLVVRNPANGETVGEVPVASKADVEAAVKRAREAQPAWDALGLAARAAVIERFQALLLEQQEEVAALATKESGKPLTEALGTEVLNALDGAKWLTTKGVKHLKPQRMRLANPLFLGRVSLIERAPVGVVAIIAPWNYPFSIPAGQVLYALLAGNAVVLKPASLTPFTALKLHELLVAAGVPLDLFQVVCGAGRETGEALIDADIDHLIFTGSVPVGRAVEARLRERAVTTTLELGGSDPAIVLDDANVELAARGVAWGRFTNCGQTCAAIKRVFVHRDVHDAFVSEVVRHAQALRLGDPMQPHIDLGPLTDARGVQDMRDFVEDARKRGGRVLCGGRARPDLGEHYFEPTVVVDLPPEARLLTEECFGPILPIVRYESEEDAIRWANSTEFGLSASVWTKDADRGTAIARRIEAGTVVVNDAMYTFAANETPWGGVKASGHGRTHGTWGLDEVTRIRHVNLVPSRLASIWWFPYGPQLRDTFAQGAEFLYGTAGDKAKRGAGLVANLARRMRKSPPK